MNGEVIRVLSCQFLDLILTLTNWESAEGAIQVTLGFNESCLHSGIICGKLLLDLGEIFLQEGVIKRDIIALLKASAQSAKDGCSFLSIRHLGQFLLVERKEILLQLLVPRRFDKVSSFSLEFWIATFNLILLPVISGSCGLILRGDFNLR